MRGLGYGRVSLYEYQGPDNGQRLSLVSPVCLSQTAVAACYKFRLVGSEPEELFKMVHLNLSPSLDVKDRYIHQAVSDLFLVGWIFLSPSSDHVSTSRGALYSCFELRGPEQPGL